MKQQPQKITASQVEELYVFTRKHFVEHYDLQTELVDHLSMAIEKQWETQPHLSFEKALQIEFKKFGVFGFMEVVEERQKALSKKYSKLIWRHFLEFFKLPKIVMTAVATLAVFFILRSGVVNEVWFAIIIMVLFVTLLLELIRKGIMRKKAQKVGRKKWMFEEMITTAGMGTNFSFVPYYFFQSIFLHTDNLSVAPVWVVGLLSFLFVGLLLVMYIMQVDIPKKAHQYLLETYPEYQLVQSS